MAGSESGTFSRRALLRYGVIWGGAAFLTACMAPTPTAPAAGAATVAPTAAGAEATAAGAEATVAPTAAAAVAGEYPRNQTLILYMHARNPTRSR